MKDKKICSRCGKEIVGKVYLLTQLDPFNGKQESYWCEDCYNDFIKDLRGEI